MLQLLRGGIIPDLQNRSLAVSPQAIKHVNDAIMAMSFGNGSLTSSFIQHNR